MEVEEWLWHVTTGQGWPVLLESGGGQAGFVAGQPFIHLPTISIRGLLRARQVGQADPAYGGKRADMRPQFSSVGLCRPLRVLWQRQPREWW